MSLHFRSMLSMCCYVQVLHEIIFSGHSACTGPLLLKVQEITHITLTCGFLFLAQACYVCKTRQDGSFVLFNRTRGLRVRVIVMSSCWASGKATSLCLRPFFPGTTLLRKTAIVHCCVSNGMRCGGVTGWVYVGLLLFLSSRHVFVGRTRCLLVGLCQQEFGVGSSFRMFARVDTFECSSFLPEAVWLTGSSPVFAEPQAPASICNGNGSSLDGAAPA